MYASTFFLDALEWILPGAFCPSVERLHLGISPNVAPGNLNINMMSQ
jgi:hypothetical protein